CDTLDQFRKTLNEQHPETDHDQRLRRPLRQPAGISRLLIDLERPVEEGNAGDQHDNGQRQQEEHMAYDIDAVADALWQHVVHDVNADVLVGEQCPGRAQKEYDAEQHPLQLKPRIRRGVENFTDSRIGRRYDHGGENEPRQTLANPGCSSGDYTRCWNQRLEQCVKSTHLPPPSARPASSAGPPFLFFVISPQPDPEAEPATLIRSRHQPSMENLVAD